ncbi:MAG: malate synthase A [Frankiaceae bacterium]
MESAQGVRITADTEPYADILTAEALDFVAALQRQFNSRRRELLAARQQRHAELAAGGTLDFLPGTQEIRDGDWQVAPPAPGLVDRRVELTGPTERKMLVNALNSGAKVYMADFEDSNAPTWRNMVGGQATLLAAIERRIDFTADGKEYKLGAQIPTLVIRPRGWHLNERHVEVDGEQMSGSLFDFGLYFFHCAQKLIDSGTGPYFYLPKMQSHLEARLWNDVFLVAQERLGIPRGTIRATVLVETIPAAFEISEILYELREHSSGCNAGRWDYIFSLIKEFRERGGDMMLPDRNLVTMTVPFMRAYTELLVKTCHAHGAHAIGGMAAFIPSRRDEAVNRAAFEKVTADKQREAHGGFDGSWVAHPDMVSLCREVFDSVLGERPNQLDRQRDDVWVSGPQLLAVGETPGEITEDGLRNNVSVGLQYLTSWLGGNGAAAIFNLMEDAATAEISRSQIWQWVHNGAKLSNGETVTADLVRRIEDEESEKIRVAVGGAYAEDLAKRAREVFEEVALADDFVEFLTLPAYELLD